MATIRGAQVEALKAILAHLSRKGYPPTMRELGEALRIKSLGHVHYLLDRLEREGYIERDYATARGIRVLYGPPAEDDTAA